MRHGHLRQPRESRAPPRAPQDVLALRRVDVVRTYLALDEPTQLKRRDQKPPADARFVRRSPCPVDVYRRFYKEVGEQWFWHERLTWSDEKLAAHLARPEIAVWELTAGNATAGYVELERHADGGVEIVYFGLTPRFIGQGLGAWMLERAVDEAWKMGATRVWLHTCTLDSPRALPNYRARGFVPFRTQRLEVDIEGTHVVAERVLD